MKKMVAQIDLATTAGQIEWQKTIEKEYKTRAAWLAKYGPEEYRPAPRMIKVKKAQLAALPHAVTAAPEAVETAPEVSAMPKPADELSYTEVLKRMQFSTTTADSFWSMHETPLNSLARQSLQSGQFNRRKTMQTL